MTHSKEILELSRNPEPADTAFIAMCEEGGQADRPMPVLVPNF
jgi:hypothetical protein